MSYVYNDHRLYVLTDEGQRQFLRIRDHCHWLLRQAGAARMQEITKGQTGDSWEIMACVDRMVELGELRELDLPHVAGQHRIFVSALDI